MTNRTEILWLYKAGRNVSFIARRAGIAPGTVRKYLCAAGIYERRPTAIAREAGHGQKNNGQLTVPEDDPLLKALRKHHMEKITCPKTTETLTGQSRK